jgi:hypothetical protein
VTNHSRLIQLDTLLNKAYNNIIEEYQTLTLKTPKVIDLYDNLFCGLFSQIYEISRYIMVVDVFCTFK